LKCLIREEKLHYVMTATSDWQMSYNLDREKYAPLQEGKLTNVILINNSKCKMVVKNVLLKFDWMGTRRWSIQCNEKINPSQTKELHDVPFTIDLGAPTGSQHYNPGINYVLLKENKWVDYNNYYDSAGDYIEIEPLPQKGYKVFVSHSNQSDDKNLLSACKKAMKSCGLTGYFAEDSPQPGYRLWDKIAREIHSSDAMLVLWTKQASESGDVREEIGMAVNSVKLEKIVTIVEKGLEVKGSLRHQENEWVIYETPNHTKALSEALKIFMTWAKEKEIKTPQLQPEPTFVRKAKFKRMVMRKPIPKKVAIKKPKHLVKVKRVKQKVVKKKAIVTNNLTTQQPS
jgi:hypothetical protein